MSALLLTACYDDSEMKSRLDKMDQRLTTVESQVASLNTQVTKEQYLYDEGGVKYAPYILAPYTFTRKAAASTSSASSRTVARNKALLDTGRCLPVSMGKVNAAVTEPADGFYRLQ